jgi:RNA polymerase sigma factor (TIGR02999 family)
MSDTAIPLTQYLRAWQDGDRQGLERAVEALHAELRRMAASRLRGDGGVVTLTPGDLLNEAILRVMQSPPAFANRAHFRATMSLLMRSVLIDHARERLAQKRGGGAVFMTLTETGIGEDSMDMELLALDQALTQLAALDARGSEVLQLTYFGGLSREEVAEALDVSVPTVDRDLKFGRAWIRKSMGLGA